MTKIPYIDEYLKEYIVLENKSLDDLKIKIPELFYFEKGIKFKVSKIKDGYVTYKITSSMKECNSIIEKWAEDLKERAEKDIDDLQHALDLWNGSPEKFVPVTEYPYNYPNSDGAPKYFKRVDDEKPRYSYQVTFGCFENKQMYEKSIKEKQLEVIRWSSLDSEKRKYLYDILKSKSDIHILHLNEISFDFYNVEKKTKKPKFPIKLTGEKLNNILGYLDEGLIDEDIIREIKDNCKVDISSLKGWEYEYESEGEMYNDSQILEYTVIFTSPNKHEYHAYDSHNAIQGWSFSGSVDFD